MVTAAMRIRAGAEKDQPSRAILLRLTSGRGAGGADAGTCSAGVEIVVISHTPCPVGYPRLTTLKRSPRAGRLTADPALGLIDPVLEAACRAAQRAIGRGLGGREGRSRRGRASQRRV